MHFSSGPGRPLGEKHTPLHTADATKSIPPLVLADVPIRRVWDRPTDRARPFTHALAYDKSGAGLSVFGETAKPGNTVAGERDRGPPPISKCALRAI